MQICILSVDRFIDAPSRNQRLYFHPAAEKDYKNLPATVQDGAGHNLDRAQQGLQPQCKFGYLSGIGSGVQELKIPYDTDTYRIVYVPYCLRRQVQCWHICTRRFQQEVSHWK